MTIPLIIVICILLLLSYTFDITSSITKIPSVILLLILGWTVQQGAIALEIPVPNLSHILPVLGTVGLVLIVLEGSLELELNKSKLPVVGKTSLMALLPILCVSFGIAAAFQYFGNAAFKIGLANAIPFAIISSAIAIPSVKNLMAKDKEFVIYESSLSDIIGVIFFNFVTLNEKIEIKSVGYFFLELLIMLIISFIATLGLAFLLNKIKQHVKFVPIILIIVLIYAISKVFHLPALLFILLFGLFLGNMDQIPSNKFMRYLQPEILQKEVHKFKELTIEIVFLIRSLFFLLFGFLIQTEELLNPETIIWAVGITIGIFLIRYIFLKLLKLPALPLLFIAPRGLITILLFLTIPLNQKLELADKSLVIQVIILTALVLMTGIMVNKSTQIETTADGDANGQIKH